MGAKNTVRPFGIPDLEVIGSEMRELVLRLARENRRCGYQVERDGVEVR